LRNFIFCVSAVVKRFPGYCFTTALTQNKKLNNTTIDHVTKGDRFH